MRLKRRDQVEWLDLPRIESPTMARHWLANNLNTNGFGVSAVVGLEDVITDDLSPYRLVWDQHALNRLLDKVEKGEVFLLHYVGSEPLIPALRRVEGKEGIHAWKPDSSLDHITQFNIEWMLSYAVNTRGIWAPVIVPKKTAQAAAPQKQEQKQLSVTNPRWEHVNSKGSGSGNKSAYAGDPIYLKVDVSGVPDGTRVTFRVFETSISPPSRVGMVNGKVTSGVGSAEWHVKVHNRSNGKDPSLEFEGQVRSVTSGRAEIPVGKASKFMFSF